MRQLLAALLTGSRSEIEPLIMDHPDAEILWQGAYPAEVAVQLSHVSNSNRIGRVSDHAADGQVKLITADFPFPITVEKVGQQWKVDAAEIIDNPKTHATGPIGSGCSSTAAVHANVRLPQPLRMLRRARRSRSLF